MMTLYGNTVDSVAGQQQNYDNYFNAINQGNRAAMERAAQQEAAYAFQRRGIQAAEEAQAANYFNQFNRDLAVNRMQQDREREAAGERRFQFGVNRDLAEKEFGLKKDEFNLRKSRDARDAERRDVVGPSLASSLDEFRREQELAQAAYEKAQEGVNSVLSLAAGRNLYNPGERKWNESPMVREDVNRYAEFKRRSDTDLKNAELAMKARNAEYNRAVQQAAAAGLYLGEGGQLTDRRTGEVYRPPARQPAQTSAAAQTATAMPPTSSGGYEFDYAPGRGLYRPGQQPPPPRESGPVIETPSDVDREPSEPSVPAWRRDVSQPVAPSRPAFSPSRTPRQTVAGSDLAAEIAKNIEALKRGPTMGRGGLRQADYNQLFQDTDAMVKRLQAINPTLAAQFL